MKEEDEGMAGEFGTDEGASAKAAGAVTDSIRKAVFGGLSALFVSEEGIRQTTGELPKDALSFLLSQTDKTRRELMRVVSDELKSFLRQLDIQGEVKEMLSGLTVEVKAEISFKENGAVISKISQDVTDKPIRKKAPRKKAKAAKKKAPKPAPKPVEQTEPEKGSNDEA